MPGADFDAALEAARKGLDAGLPEAADRRLRARLGGGPPPRRRLRRGRVAGALGAGLALALAAVVGLRSPGAPPQLGGFALVGPSADFAATVAADSRVTLTAGRGVLRDQALGGVLELAAPATVRREADGVEVTAGTVTVEVDPRHPRPAPFRVRVSAGEIEVLGTRFTVTQNEGGGVVRLERGAIRFRAKDGRVRQLEPGQSLAWPLPPVEAPAPAAPGPRPPPLLLPPPPKPRPPPAAAPAPFDPEPLLNQVAQLRSRGQFEEAVTALTGALGERHSPATDERLSFELGAILTRQLRDAERACAHWRRHQQGFPKGRYQTEVHQAREQLQCAD